MNIKFVAFHHNPPRQDSCNVLTSISPETDYINIAAAKAFELSHRELCHMAQSINPGLNDEIFIAAGNYMIMEDPTEPGSDQVNSWFSNCVATDITKHWQDIVNKELRKHFAGSKLKQTISDQWNQNYQ